MAEIDILIGNLAAFDTKKYYDMEFKDVEKLAEPTVKQLIEIGKDDIGKIGSLLDKEETWSCYFALKIMRGLKDKRAAPYLVEFLKRDDGDSVDYYENYEEAMYAAQELGKEAVPALVEAVKEAIALREYKSYLFGALFDAKSPETYALLSELAEDFLKNEEKYEWLEPDFFFSSFRHHEQKEAIPILEKIRAKLDEHRETDDAIEYLTDKEAYERNSKIQLESAKKAWDEYEKKTNEMLEKYKQTLKFPEALDMEDSYVDFDENEGEGEIVFKKDVLQGIEFASLFRGGMESIVIDKSNTAQYEPLLMAIEHAVYDYCQQSPSLKDKDVIDSLKAVRDNLCCDFEEGSLEQQMVFALKTTLLSHDYSEAEVSACVSKVLNSAKLHRAESGSRGYLTFISEFFEEPEDFEEDDNSTYEAG